MDGWAAEETIDIRGRDRVTTKTVVPIGETRELELTLGGRRP